MSEYGFYLTPVFSDTGFFCPHTGKYRLEKTRVLTIYLSYFFISLFQNLTIPYVIKIYRGQEFFRV